MTPWEWDETIHGWRNVDTGDVITVDDMIVEIASLRQQLEAAERNSVERKHIDATPDADYPLRILRAYRADCDMRWAKSSDGKSEDTPLIKALNDMQDQRAAILDGAIAAFSAGESET